MLIWTKRGFFAAFTIGVVIILLSVFCGNTRVYDASKGGTAVDLEEFYSFTDEPRVKNYEAVIPYNVSPGMVFAVYTTHSEIWIEKDAVPIYSETKGNTLFGKTTGYGWCFIPLHEADAGKTISVHCLFAYADQPVRDPVFFFDTIPDVYRTTARKYAAALLTGIVLIILGIGFSIYTISTNRIVKKIYPRSDLSVLYLGIFALLLGLWSGNQSQLSSLFITSKMLNVSLTYVPLVLMIPVFLIYVREMYSDPKHWVWDIACGANIIVALTTMLLQLFNIADFRQLLAATHFMIGVSTIIIIVMFIRDIVYKRATKMMRGHMLPIMICFFCALGDVASYYNGAADSNVFGRIGFLILILYSGLSSLRNTRAIILQGRESELYKLLATKDALTGLDNRTALVFAMSAAKRLVDKKVGFVMIDLNDLKHCNDTKGHKAGDIYICAGASVIKRAFENYGTCFRIGGDEFVVVIQNPDSQGTQDCLEKMFGYQKEYNSVKENYPMGIAWGYSEYSRTRDASLEETLARADAQMYENKKLMKPESV